MRAFKLLLPVFILLLCFSCKKKEESPVLTPEAKQSSMDIVSLEHANLVVAKVGNKEITVGDVAEQINQLSPYIRRRWAAPEKRKEFVQKLIEIELLSQEAKKRGLESSPFVQRAVKQAMIRLFIQNELQNQLLPEKINENLAKAEYEKNWEIYNTPTKYKISQIVLATEKEALSVISKVKKAQEAEIEFAQLATALSLDKESSSKGGDLGYFKNPTQIRNKTQKVEATHELAVIEAIWKMKEVGELFEPIKTEKGFHVLRLEDIVAAEIRPFKSVARQIEAQLLQKKRKEKLDEYVSNLRKEAEIEIFSEKLDEFDFNDHNKKELE